MAPRYQTLAELAAAYKAGEVTVPVTLDNDATFLYVPESADPDGEWTQVFDGGHPQELLEAALDLLGVPHQGA
jgi:hypothetical protein